MKSPTRPLVDLPVGGPDQPEGDLAAERAAWEREREMLLELLAHQQRVAQAGLVTAGLSHDIKNHVHVLMGVAGLALKSSDPQRWRSALDLIEQQCHDLSDTATAFLHFVRRGEDDPETSFETAVVVEQTGRLVETLAKSRCVQLTWSVVESGLVRGHSRLAIQAIVNLVSNAIRACSKSRGAVEISASVPLAGICRISVADDGPGIPEPIRAELFRPFVGASGPEGGHGLGLFIVRQTVRKLGGSIKVRTSPQGTTFHIDLPAHTPGPDDDPA